MSLEKIYDEIVELLKKNGLLVKTNNSKRRIFAYVDTKNRIIISLFCEKMNDETFTTKTGDMRLW
ncbi:MAG: hypothetical protein ACI4T2_03910 [Christensenellales bacterium]